MTSETDDLIKQLEVQARHPCPSVLVVRAAAEALKAKVREVDHATTWANKLADAIALSLEIDLGTEGRWQKALTEIQEEISAGAQYFNMFQTIQSWMCERDWWTEDDIDEHKPENTLIRGLKRKEEELSAKSREVNALEQTIREKNQELSERDEDIRLLQEEIKRLKGGKDGL